MQAFIAVNTQHEKLLITSSRIYVWTTTEFFRGLGVLSRCASDDRFPAVIYIILLEIKRRGLREASTGARVGHRRR